MCLLNLLINNCGCNFTATRNSANKTADQNATRLTTTFVWLLGITVILMATFQETEALPYAKSSGVHPHPKHRSPDRPVGSASRTGSNQRRKAIGCSRKLIKRTDANVNFCTPERVERLFPEQELPWQNPCSASAYSDNADIVGKHVDFDPLKRLLKSMLRTKYGSCNKTDDSTTNWCHEKPRYTFFEHSTRTDKMCLRLEHKRLQVYVAGLSYLSRLNENDKRHNLRRIAQNAKTLLCEIETAINQTGCVKPPPSLTPREMCLRLNLHSLTSEDDTEVDVIFAKANFGKYLRGLNRTLSSHRPNSTCDRPKPFGSARRPLMVTSLTVSSNANLGDINSSNKSHRGRSVRRKNQRKHSGRPTQNDINRNHSRKKAAKNV